MALSINWTTHFITGVLKSSDYFWEVHTQKTGYNKEIETGVHAEIIRTVTVERSMLREADLPKFLW